MKLKSFFLSALALLLAINVNAQLKINAQLNFVGNGNITEENRSVEPFSAIELSGSMDVFFTQAQEYSVSVHTDSNLQEFVQTDVRGNILKVSSKNRNYSNLTVVIKAPQIAYIDSKRADIHITDGFKAERFLANVSSGSLQIGNDFNVDKLTIDASNSSTVSSAYPMEMAEKLELFIVGGGNIALTVDTPEVDIDATSTGRITIKGQTDVLKVVSKSAAKVTADELTARTATLSAATLGQILANVTESAEVISKADNAVTVKGNAQITRRIK